MRHLRIDNRHFSKFLVGFRPRWATVSIRSCAITGSGLDGELRFHRYRRKLAHLRLPP
jgi:hypothetical protein